MNTANTRKAETMTSRERVLRTINHLPADRMPIDLGFHYSTGISAFAYHNLRKYLGLSTAHIQIPDMIHFLARVDEDILKRFHCDCMLLNPGWSKSAKWNPRGEYEFTIPAGANPAPLEDGSWVVGRGDKTSRMPKGGFFFDGQSPKLDDETEEETMKRYAREAERIYKDTDYFTMYIGYHAYFSCDDIDWQCRMLTDPEEIFSENKRVHERQLRSAAKVLY
jgi:uroporphyrinogen decarboxylase